MQARTTRTMDTEELIRSYEGKGVKCFPVRPDKRPFRGSWEPYVFESVEKRLARFRKKCNTGKPFLIAGIVGPQLVIDVDDQTAFVEFLQGASVDFTGPVVVTPTSGRHYWARNDHGLPPMRLDFGEVRTGNGNYVILPGSGFPADYEKKGKRVFEPYVWDENCVPLHEWEGELPGLPQPLLLRVLSALQERKKASPKRRKGKLVEGERNTELFERGCALRGRGMSRAEIAEDLLKQNAERCDPPLPEEEVLRVAGSAAGYEPNCQADEMRQLHFVRLFEDFLDDPGIRSLTPRGFRVTVDLLKSYRGGHDYDLTLPFNHSSMSRHTTSKGLKEVQERGIFYKVQQGGARDRMNVLSKYRLTPKYFKMARLGQKGPFWVKSEEPSGAYACTAES